MDLLAVRPLVLEPSHPLQPVWDGEARAAAGWDQARRRASTGAAMAATGATTAGLAMPAGVTPARQCCSLSTPQDVPTPPHWPHPPHKKRQQFL